MHRDLVRHERVAALWMMASGTPSLSLQTSATRTRPISGETTVRLSGSSEFLKCRQHRHREEVVERTVEEALDLRGVDVDRHDAVSAGGLEEVSHKTSRDRLAAAALLVLARVRVVRHDDRDALGTRALERVDHDELLHEPPLVHGARVALHHEHVSAADRALETGVDLTVGERARVDAHKIGADLVCDGLRQCLVRTP